MTFKHQSSSKSVVIWWDTTVSAYRSTTPYNKGFVEFLKSTIPASDRHWDPEHLVWTFAEKYLDVIVDLCKKTFGINSVSVVTKQQSQTASAPAAVRAKPVADAALDFLKLLPPEAAQAAYRKAAFLLHPDRGGDMNKMSEVNALWDRLSKEIWGL